MKNWQKKRKDTKKQREKDNWMEETEENGKRAKWIEDVWEDKERREGGVNERDREKLEVK